MRELRGVAPQPTILLEWEKRVEILGEDGTPTTSSGALRLGWDYFEIIQEGQHRLYDFALRRVYGYADGGPSYESLSLFGPVAFRHHEAISRANIARFAENLGADFQFSGQQQFWFEAELRVRAQNLKPLIMKKRKTQKNTISIRWNDETAATFRFDEMPLDREHSDMLARSLRYEAQIHPEALEKVLPFRQLPAEISSLHAFHAKKKARTTIRFSVVHKEYLAFPLPKGLPAKSPGEDARGPADRVAAIGMRAIAGDWGKGPPSLEAYVVDAKAAGSSQDRFGTYLAWLAASLHYPDKFRDCDRGGRSDYCRSYRSQIVKALKDARSQAVFEASRHCARGEKEAGVRKLAKVNLNGQRHGYVVNMILGCLLWGLPSDKIKDIEDQGTIALGPYENAVLAIKGNPYIPSFYIDIGKWYKRHFETGIAWQMFDVGRALGGDVAGDALEQIERSENELLRLYPGYF
ncbi:MAG: hypothetical protein ACYSUD_16870 [Planctomycetota bacterium]